jgi:hypothetical protein
MGSIKFCGLGGRGEREGVMKVASNTRFDVGTTLNMSACSLEMSMNYVMGIIYDATSLCYSKVAHPQKSQMH